MECERVREREEKENMLNKHEMSSFKDYESIV